MSDGDLEERCETPGEDIHISTSGIPIIRREEDAIVDDDSPADSRIYGNPVGNPPLQQQMEQIAVHAPLGDGKFWLWVHLNFVAYALRKLSEEKEIAEVRGELLEANVAREYQGRQAAEKALKKAQLGISLSQADYANALFALFDADDKRIAAEKERDTYKRDLDSARAEIQQALARIMQAEKTTAGKEAVILLYEQMFGSREKLHQLMIEQQECERKGNKCIRANYACIDALIQSHHTGKCPKTAGQRMAYCFERITESFVRMIDGIYNRLIGKSKTKETAVKLEDCG